MHLEPQHRWPRNMKIMNKDYAMPGSKSERSAGQNRGLKGTGRNQGRNATIGIRVRKAADGAEVENCRWEPVGFCALICHEVILASLENLEIANRYLSTQHISTAYGQTYSGTRDAGERAFAVRSGRRKYASDQTSRIVPAVLDLTDAFCSFRLTRTTGYRPGA